MRTWLTWLGEYSGLLILISIPLTMSVICYNFAPTEEEKKQKQEEFLERTHYQFIREGNEACKAGVPAEACPYAAGFGGKREERELWLQGWIQAKKEMVK